MLLSPQAVGKENKLPNSPSFWCQEEQMEQGGQVSGGHDWALPKGYEDTIP